MRAEPRVKELPLEAVALLGEGRINEAIRSLRQSEGLSRSEARRRIDAHFDRDPMLRVQIEAIQSARRRRFFFWFLLVDLAHHGRDHLLVFLSRSRLMLLIGMFDSPFVRRVAVTLKLLEIPFEHGNWSVGKDFERIREFNPLGRVPTLVLPNGEKLFESAAILDYLDEFVGAERALLPARGPDRRTALNLMAMATGAAEKGVMQVYEGVFRPESKRHQPWLDRLRAADERVTRGHRSLHGRARRGAVAGRQTHDAGRHHRGLRLHFSQ